MATYAIGDIQGCFQTFQKLLSKIRFRPGRDRLWLLGDLINRGPDSLKTLEFVYQHQAHIQCVLGNHDLHFLAVASGQHKATNKDTFEELLSSSRLARLTGYLIQQPLFYYDPQLNFAMAHAGVPQGWDLKQAQAYASEVSVCLQSEQRLAFFSAMYGNLPARWKPDLVGAERLRYITNALTRMRYCYADGGLELTQKLAPGKQPPNLNLTPWFENCQINRECSLVFGHWASLEGRCSQPDIYAIDTGCVWGGQLTALRLEDKRLFHCDSVE